MGQAQDAHWHYTIAEWLRDPFIQITAKMPPPEDVKVVYDVGANVGGWTEVMHRRYPEASFVTFEPVKENYDALVKNVPYASHVNFGIFYEKRESRILWRGSNVGAFFVEHIDTGPDIVEYGETMQLRTFEELSLPKPDLIKFDVEGAEENIIEHSPLVKKTKWLIVEWHPNTEPFEFFKKHLPNHRIVVNLEKMQFLLCLK